MPEKPHTAVAFLLGDEQLVLNSFRRIRKMFLGEGLDGDTVSASSAIEVERELLCEPFFGFKLVLAETSCVDDAFMDMIESCASLVPRHCMLVVRGASLATKHLTRAKKIGEPLVRVLRFAAFDKFDDAAVFVRRVAAENDAEMNVAAARMLVRISGMDAGLLSSEVRKLAGATAKITEKIVAAFAFPDTAGEFYRLYSKLGDGDGPAAVDEVRALAAETGAEAVEMAFMKLLCVAVRMAETNFGGGIKVKRDRHNACWWADKPKSGKTAPSGFMKGVARKICDRHGIEGVCILLRKMNRNFAMHRKAPAERPWLAVLEAKALAICGKGGDMG